jgi:hypothetical protein
VTLVPALSDPSAEDGCRENTCANSDVLKAGPDRFLVAYTDYDHRDRVGRIRKAVLVREVAAEPVLCV